MTLRVHSAPYDHILANYICKESISPYNHIRRFWEGCEFWGEEAGDTLSTQGTYPLKKNPNTPVTSEDELMTKGDKSHKETNHREGDTADAVNRRVGAPKRKSENTLKETMK